MIPFCKWALFRETTVLSEIAQFTFSVAFLYVTLQKCQKQFITRIKLGITVNKHSIQDVFSNQISREGEQVDKKVWICSNQWKNIDLLHPLTKLIEQFGRFKQCFMTDDVLCYDLFRRQLHRKMRNIWIQTVWAVGCTSKYILEDWESHTVVSRKYAPPRA